MKKIIFILLLAALTISNNLFSQKKIEVGLYMGSSITSMSGVQGLADAMTVALTELAGKDFPISKSPRNFLFNTGGFISYNIAPWLTLKGGIEYAPKGETFHGEVYLSTSLNMVSEVLQQSTVLKVGYLEFPISVQFSTRTKDNSGKAYYYLSLGVSPSSKVFSKMDNTSSLVEKGFDSNGVTSKVLDSEHKTENLDGISGSDLGMFCSVGVGINTLFLDLKYNRGMKNIFENNNETAVRNNLVALCLGFKF